MSGNEVRFLKGHGTENDFIVLPDYDGHLTLTAELVRALCERRSGLGADGVLRVVRSDRADEPGVAELAPQAAWFMDYRNGDGSIAEMCGNGVRVFGLFLAVSGLVRTQRSDDGATTGTIPVATRAGIRPVTLHADGTLTAGMGLAEGPGAAVEVETPGVRTVGASVSVGNPHVVVFVADLADPGSLTQAPALTPAPPEGANVEFVVPRGPGHIAMRVFERGVGETRSCGTGACAAAVAAAARDGLAQEGAPWTYRVDVPGGRLEVSRAEDGQVYLRGPAVLLASGELSPDWVAAHA